MYVIQPLEVKCAEEQQEVFRCNHLNKVRCVKMTEEERRLKEIKHLLWLKSELIKQTKKEMVALREERDSIEGQKRLVRKAQRNKK